MNLFSYVHFHEIALLSRRGQDKGILAEDNNDVCSPLWMSFGEGLVVGALEVQPKNVRDAILEVCSEEGALESKQGPIKCRKPFRSFFLEIYFF